MSWPFPILYGGDRRDSIENALKRMGGSHVVFIRYSASHNVHHEWVYNSPDIDSQQVIWARDLGEENRKLEAHYPGRRFWLLDPDSLLAQPEPVTFGR